MGEPTTIGTRISFIDRYGQRVVFNVLTSCGLCRVCLVTETKHCAYGGPYDAEGIVLCLEKR